MARRGSLLLVAAALLVAVVAAAVPPTCERIECPAYEVVDSANGFEIRRYSDAVWITTAPIEDISFVAATRTGFLQLFNYIQGKNAYNETIEMTAPVLTRVSPSDGPFCASTFTVSFYVPAKNQADPPAAEGLRVERWAGARYAAVRRFGGFVADADVGEQAARLDASLQGTRWAAAVNDARRADPAASPYTVAQYNSPFEFSGRVNEIWMLFDNDDAAAATTDGNPLAPVEPVPEEEPSAELDAGLSGSSAAEFEDPNFAQVEDVVPEEPCLGSCCMTVVDEEDAE